MANTFFLSDGSGRAALWCERIGKGAGGLTKFRVINGGWNGLLDEAAATFHPGSGHDPRPGYEILWEGQVPPQCNYNEAFLWLKRTHGILGVLDK